MKRIFNRQSWIALALLVVGIIFIGAAIFVYTGQVSHSDVTANWQVTLIGSNGEQKTLSYAEIKTMVAYTGHGGFFTTTGVVNGPYEARGVPIEDLCALVGGLTPSDLVIVSAADGYSTMLDYDQVKGNFITYDLTTMKEVPHGELKPILMYEQDGASLTDDGGKPLRLAIVGPEGLLTEGLYWVKWINKIAVITPKQSGSMG